MYVKNMCHQISQHSSFCTSKQNETKKRKYGH